jgi:hypothetical protein
MWKCYPIDRRLQMRRDAKSSCGLRHNCSPAPIEETIYVFFMRPRLRAIKAPFTMNSMACETFRIYMPLS